MKMVLVLLALFSMNAFAQVVDETALTPYEFQIVRNKKIRIYTEYTKLLGGICWKKLNKEVKCTADVDGLSINVKASLQQPCLNKSWVSQGRQSYKTIKVDIRKVCGETGTLKSLLFNGEELLDWK